MSGFVCPHCNQPIEVFAGDGGREMAQDFGVPFLGRIPIDPALAHACDMGAPFVETDRPNPTAEAIRSAFEPLLKLDSHVQPDTSETDKQENKSTMKIAIPMTNGKLSAHFGHCEEFALVDINEQTKEIANVTTLQPPAHEPGALPKWLGEQKANVIIAGGMGQRAQQLFAQNNIKVIVGAPTQSAEEIASAYLNNTLETGDNICDH
jgi:predicted Fe-Mo cluster-binding NifX family protein